MKRKQPACFFSGPSFARELMDRMPTGVVMAAETEALANRWVGCCVVLCCAALC
jgi:glycerol-3-phosphate dehydrogenase